MKQLLLISALALTLVSCNRVTSTEVRLTSEAGDKYALQDNITFRKGQAPMPLVTINPADERQTIDGFGASITESSAFVLACLTPEQRAMVLRELFGEEGATTMSPAMRRWSISPLLCIRMAGVRRLTRKSKMSSSICSSSFAR